ncbi:MAG: ring-cleaving dioxygenase, partial [Acidimicrobiia bacterium]
HVTATANDAQEDLDFYVGLLGQRLVKKTVNFDNHHVYHFYYGNEAGTPGTIWTTFPYKGMGVRVGTKGAGQITVTSFSVPAAALDFWRKRLTAEGLEFSEELPRFGEHALRFSDPSGLVIRLVGAARDDRVPWVRPGITANQAIRGIHGVTLLVRDPSKTIALLTEMLDGTVIAESGDTSRVGIGGDGPGHVVEVTRAGAEPDAINGLGTVHHVAFAIGDGAQQLAIREALIRRGLRVTDVMDRQYFTSIYLREPNGVLFEVATIPPGFATDESLADLGTALKLPPWEEQHRAAIEAGLPAVTAR